MSTLSFEVLQSLKRSAFRNGYWYRLTDTEKALFKASIIYAKMKRRIVNRKIVGMILELVDGLKTSLHARIVRLGLSKAAELRISFTQRGVLKWCPRLGTWLRDPGYIAYLGAAQANTSGYYPS